MKNSLNILVYGYKPLCVLQNELLVFKNFIFYRMKIADNTLTKVCSVKISFWRKYLGKLRYAERLLRLQPKCTIQLNQKYFIIAFLKKIYCLDILSGNLLEIFKCREGFSDILNFCHYSENGKNFILFGEYGSNPERKEVKIYRISDDLNVREVYSFKPGEIRHIHNIVFNQIKSELYILTGDNEATSGIYRTDLNFSEVVPIVIGQQKYRSVVAFPVEKGLLYATDSVMEQNYIYLLNWDEGQVKVTKITELNGSCIYGVQNMSGYWFSTTVESMETKGNRWKALFSNKLGTGILSRKVEVILVTKDLRAEKRFDLKKDFLPMKLFQYGCINFPTNMENRADLFCYPIAVTQYDNTIVRISCD